MIEHIELVIEDARWKKLDIAQLAAAAFATSLECVGVKELRYEFTILACDDAKISELNQEFRDKGGATNVLSWPSFDLGPDKVGAEPPPPPPFSDFDSSIGDIAIAYETCEREAAAYGLEMQDHVTHLLIHACLHLLGFDHIFDADAVTMQTIEIKALAKLGIDNPY